MPKLPYLQVFLACYLRKLNYKWQLGKLF